MQLSTHELRVLGSLIEKEITTPDIYPLSLNALQAAANQRSSRDPVLDLVESDIRQALHALEDRGLASPALGGLGSAGARVPKYEHHARTVLNLRRDETALLCLLLLRGPQTPGELRSRADRLFSFDDLSSVVSALERLLNRAPSGDGDTTTGPLVTVLPRQPGSREVRYAHLLGSQSPAVAPASGQSHTAGAADQPGTSAAPGGVDVAGSPLAALVADVARLEARIASLEDRLRRLEGDPAAVTEPSPRAYPGTSTADAAPVG